MLIAVLVLAVSMAVFTVAMGLTLNGEQLGTAYPQLLVAQAALGHVGMLVMLGITALTAVNTFNGGFVTLSRFIYAVAREGKLPRALTRLNDRAVPVLPVYLLGGSSLVLAGVVALTGSFLVMVSVCAALEMMIYAAAGYVVWRLRRQDPDRARPFRIRGGAFVALGVHRAVRGPRPTRQRHRRPRHHARCRCSSSSGSPCWPPSTSSPTSPASNAARPRNWPPDAPPGPLPVPAGPSRRSHRTAPEPAWGVSLRRAVTG